MRVTQEKLLPMIRDLARLYLLNLEIAARRELLKAYIYFISGLMMVLLSIYVGRLGLGDEFGDGPLVYRISTILLIICAAFVLHGGSISRREYLKYKSYFLIYSRWMEYNRPAIVCREIFGKYFPRSDQNFVRKTLEEGYDAQHLIEYFYQRELIRGKK